MSAQPLDDYDPDDPVEILRILPQEFREQFLAEYEAAVSAAREVAAYHRLHTMLRLWRLRAVAYSDPEYATRLADIRRAVRDGDNAGSVSIEDVVPGWPDRR